MGSPKALLGAFGNPLLDFIISVNDEEERALVDKYSLVQHNSMEMDTLASGLYDEVINWQGGVTMSPGGCALNTSRVLQWLQSSRPGIVTFFGSVGRDEGCNKLKKLMVKDGVTVRLNEIQDFTSGHCIALSNGQERTLVANVGAANVYTLKHIIHQKALLQELSIYYIEGFFLSHSPEASNYLAGLSCTGNKVLAFNLCGSYICSERDYVLNVSKMVHQINVLFGNAFEFEALDSTSLKHGLMRIPFFEEMDSMEEEEPESENAFQVSASSRLVIITDGPRDIICLDLIRKKKVRIPVQRIPKDEIKDTVGAGDSFIAGYLSGMIQGRSNTECIKQGISASQMIIRQIGVTLPGPKV